MRIAIQDNHSLALPQSFEDIDTSKVRWIFSMEDAASALQRYEEVIRQEMASASHLDQFFDIPDSKPNPLLCLLLNSLTSVGRYDAYCLGGKWFCEKFGHETPKLLGMEVCDEDTGDWSFILIGYGFLSKILHTWAGHFANAHQMAALIKALSESAKLCYPCFQDLCINNTPEVFAKDYGLPFSALYCNPIYSSIVRLPVTPEHPYNQDNEVRWIGLSNIVSNTRA